MEIISGATMIPVSSPHVAIEWPRLPQVGHRSMHGTPSSLERLESLPLDVGSLLRLEREEENIQSCTPSLASIPPIPGNDRSVFAVSHHRESLCAPPRMALPSATHSPSVEAPMVIKPGSKRVWRIQDSTEVGEQLSIRLFVYGTLMQDLPNHQNHLAQARFLGGARTQPLYELRSLAWYPGLLRGGAQVVHGELYLIHAKQLAKIDRLEGHPDFYERQTIELQDGQTAWAYFLPRTQEYLAAPLIASGSWRSHLECNDDLD